jgi:hypothetical protein
LPLSVEDVAVHVPELPLSMGFVVLPVSFVASSVRPDLNAKAMPHIALPLSLVNCSVLKPKLFAILQGQVLKVSVMILEILSIIVESVSLAS